MKTANVLSSNRHNCDEDNDEILASFNREPIVCKLSDFGESRSEEVQTQLLCSTKTSNVDRGTPSFMAPETRTMLEVRTDDGKINGVIFLDICKVFDSVNHEILLKKLETQFGIHDTA